MKTALKSGVALALAVVLVGLAGTVLGFPSLTSPFRTDTVVRDHAAVVQALEDLSEYRAATGEYQIIVDIEKDTRFVPGFLKGERTTFLAQGSVDALVDLGGLGPDSITVGEDGAVTVVLPPARLAAPQVDHEASGVLDRDRGLLDRIGGVFSDSPTSERDLLLEAEERLTGAAVHSDLLATAEANTAAMIETLLGAAGIEVVTVRFERPAPVD